MPQTAQPTQVVSAQTVAAMSPAERAAYFGSLPADVRDAQMAAYASEVESANARFMAMAIRKVAPMIPQGSNGGSTVNYAQGATFNFDFPTAGGAWAEAIIITVNIVVTLAAGTGATYGANINQALSIFDRFIVNLNGTQHNLRPFWLKTINQLSNLFGASMPQAVIAGQHSATIDGQLSSTLPVAVGANTWTYKVRIPLNVLNDGNPAGFLPMMSSASRPQLVINTAQALLGPDPILNSIRATGGTGNAVSSVTGTIQADVQYRDGTNLWTPEALKLDMSDVPAIQYITEQPINNLVAGVINRGRITTLLPHYMVLSAVIDGTTAGQYVSSVNNITVAELDMDSVGQNSFYKYGSASGTNISLFDLYERIRNQYRQDVDDGIIPWVFAPGDLAQDLQSMDGIAALNMAPGGWPDVNHAYQLTTTSNANGFVPRVETCLVSMNPAGLKLVTL